MQNWDKISKYSAFLLVLSFLIGTSLAILAYPNYDPMKNYLSDLGVGQKSANFFNYGLMLTGLSGIVLSYSLLMQTREIKSKIGAVFLLLSTISLILVGVFTENSGTLHYVFSVGFFALSALGSFILSFELKNPIPKIYLLLVILFGITSLPILEHLAVLLFGVWILTFVKR